MARIANPYYFSFRPPTALDGPAAALEPPPADEAAVITTLRERMAAASGDAPYDALRAVPRARVPIVTNKPARRPAPGARGRAFDLSLRLQGVVNSALIRRYCADDASVRVAAAAAKAWAGRVRIVDPRSGWLSSYAVVVMFIFACLRTGALRFHSPADFVVADCAPVPPPPPQAPVPAPALAARIGDLLLTFWHFYARVFDWERDAVCVRRAPNPTPAKAAVLLLLLFKKLARIANPYHFSLQPPTQKMLIIPLAYDTYVNNIDPSHPSTT